MALADAELSPDAVDYIAAHGTGTPLNDTTETLAIKRALGEHAEKVAISSNKSMLGHMFGAAGAISAIASVLAIRDNVLPPTMNLYEPDPECDLDYVPLQARESQVNVAMSNAFGFGGQNGSLLVRRFTG
jgi:3-oxoacyl-[acyl-carrier-protein] synthase II